MSKLTARATGGKVADNLWIAAGFGLDRREKLRELTGQWMEAHHPAIVSGGFVYCLVDGDAPDVLQCQVDGKLLRFRLCGSLRARYGAYAPFARRKLIALDWAAGSTPVAAEKQASDQADSGIVFIVDIVDEADRESFLELWSSISERGLLPVVYFLPSMGQSKWFSARGGTGLLEPYPADSSIRRRVHERNLAVTRNCARAYGLYIKLYCSQVEAAGDESSLRAIGPPDSPPQFPRPPGASEPEYGELARAGVPSPSPLEAWRAIRLKLDALWGERSAGAAWVKASIGLDAGDMLAIKTHGGQAVPTGTVDLNFEADTEGRIILGEKHSLSARLAFVKQGEPGPTESKLKGRGQEGSEFLEVSRGDDGKVDTKLTGGKLSATVQVDKEGKVTEFEIKLGPYNFKLSEDGTCKVSAGFATVSGNAQSGYVAISDSYSFKTFVQDHIPRHKSGAVPEWVSRLPDIKASWEVGVQIGPNQSDVMRVIAGCPGFWQMRPRAEFRKLAWSSFDPDEQGQLSILGFDQASWDFKRLPPATTRAWARLTGAQRLAALCLPVPAADPYWGDFWQELRKETSPIADLLVRVLEDDRPVTGSLVRVHKAKSRLCAVAQTDAAGVARFEAIPGGDYELFLGAVESPGGSEPRAVLHVPRGECVEHTLNAEVPLREQRRYG